MMLLHPATNSPQKRVRTSDSAQPARCRRRVARPGPGLGPSCDPFHTQDFPGARRLPAYNDFGRCAREGMDVMVTSWNAFSVAAKGGTAVIAPQRCIAGRTLAGG